MKKRMHILLLFAAVLLLSLGGSASAKKSTLNGWVTEGKKTYYYSNGEKLKKQWVEVDGKYYWLNKNGVRRSKRGWYTRGKYQYYICKGGYRAEGLKKIDGKKYYFNESTGRLVTGKTAYQINGKWYRITSKGVVKKADRSNIKVDCSIKTQEFIAAHTTAGMSKRQKLRACFNYLESYSRFDYSKPVPTAKEIADKSWPYTFAVEMLDSGLRNHCVGFAALFASCAKELGYEPYVILTDALHCFVRIDGKYYDNMSALFGASAPAVGNNYTVKSKVKFK